MHMDICMSTTFVQVFDNNAQKNETRSIKRILWKREESSIHIVHSTHSQSAVILGWIKYDGCLYRNSMGYLRAVGLVHIHNCTWNTVGCKWKASRVKSGKRVWELGFHVKAFCAQIYCVGNTVLIHVLLLSPVTIW